MEDLLLEVKDLNIEFHDHLIPETVVYDFDLTLQKGEIVGLVGESGSGKSMSALAIAGLLSRKDMKKRGFKFFGTTICYAHLQASGFVNDHLAGCICRQTTEVK